MYRGIFFLFLSTIIWGIPQPLLFNEIKHIPALEVVCHRSIWSFFFLLFGIFFLGKFSLFINIFKDKKLIIGLSITGLLIAINWSGFIISIGLEKLQDASLGYYISPLIYIALGYLFLKEKLNLSKIFSIILMLVSIFILIIDYGTIPYLAISIGLTWATYGLIRKKLNVDAEIGLLFESGIISIMSLPYLIYLFFNKEGYFLYSGYMDTSLLIFSGLFTIIPLFFFNIGVKYLSLGFAGVIFFLTPTFHFLTSIIILNEEITYIKLLTFIIIWIAVAIFVNEKIREN